MGFILIIVGLIFIYLFNFYYIQRRKLPPGPFPLPFVGNTYSFINTSVDLCLQQWKYQYGDIMTIWFGTVPMVTLHNSKVIYDTFVKDADSYVGRMTQSWNEVIRGGHLGVIFAEGALWKEQRRFALHVFRNLGLGRNIMQERVLDDVIGLIEHVKSKVKNGCAEINMFDELDISVGSIINSLTFGYRLSRDDRSDFVKVKKITTEAVSFFNKILVRVMDGKINLLKSLPFFNDVYNANVKHANESRAFFGTQIDAHVKNIDLESDEEPTDFVEAYLRQQHMFNKTGVEHSFTRSQLNALIYDLWIAGQETTATTLAWMLIYIIQNPDVQRKAHSELDEFIGDRIITTDDKTSLKYINAIVAETQRLCNLVPMNVPHKTTRDVEIMGYKIPKDTVIVDQISTVLHDERYFPNPTAFKPERFIDSNDKFFQPPELIPFGVGKRACLGEGLARLELFLFTANLLNQFEFTEVPGKPVTGEKIITATICPTPWVCSVKQRQ